MCPGIIIISPGVMVWGATGYDFTSGSDARAGQI